jgi:hypothetical protein
MELIPILSTIILVATISTFILAVGAYILYKVQEKRADEYAGREVEHESAELLEPAEYGARQLVIEKPEDKQVFVHHHYQPVDTNAKNYKNNRIKQEVGRRTIKREPAEPKFLKFTSEGYVTTDEDQDAGVIRWQ